MVSDFDIVRNAIVPTSEDAPVHTTPEALDALGRIEARLRERTHRLHACQDENERLLTTLSYCVEAWDDEFGPSDPLPQWYERARTALKKEE